MNFVDWFLTVDMVAFDPIKKLFKKWLDEGGYKDVKGLHIIGQCQSCTHWIKKTEEGKGQCEMRVGDWFYNDGCLKHWKIKWEKKDA